ncbi:MAG: hypothetical protein ACRBHB_23030 [Arenicella sp.]
MTDFKESISGGGRIDSVGGACIVDTTLGLALSKGGSSVDWELAEAGFSNPVKAGEK